MPPRIPLSFPRASRTLATLSPHTPPPTTPFQVFDPKTKASQRDRAARREKGEKSRTVDYLRRELADRLIERFEDIKNPPANIMDIASHAGQLSKYLGELQSTKHITMMELSEATLWRDQDSEFPVKPLRLHHDPEDLLAHPQIDDNTLDCVVSSAGLNWVNDFPGVLTQIRRALKPDAPFLGAVLGGDTLFELRTSLQLAEQERKGGIANRISPMVDPRDTSSLLQRAGFTLLTVDIEDLSISYPSIWELMEDLQDMGETNAIVGRRGMISKDVLIAADAIYREMYGNKDGTVPATFQIIYLIGWKPSPTQPKPLERGSAKTNLKDVL